MKKNLVKILVLYMLSIDDEPLNLILNEAKVDKSNTEYLKKPYKKQDIDDNDIKEALKELIRMEYIKVLDEKGNEILDFDISEILNSMNPYEYWFTITSNGKAYFDKNYNTYWNAYK